MGQASDPILVAGGGVDGLEKAAEFGEIGAGIQLGPNAFHAFDRLGVSDAARAIAIMSAKSQEEWRDALAWLYGDGTGLDGCASADRRPELAAHLPRSRRAGRRTGPGR